MPVFSRMGAVGRARRILSRTWSLSVPERLLLVRMVGLASVIELGLHTVRLNRLAKVLGVTLDWSKDPPSPPGIPTSLGTDERRKVTNVLRVMRHWPFAEGTCLRQSLMLGRVLKNHDPLLRIGVQGRDGEIVAHAWIEFDGVALGGQDGYLPLWRAGTNVDGDDR